MAWAKERADSRRRRKFFSPSPLTTDTTRPTPVPNPVRREPQPPDVDHTSPKLATHGSLSSGHRLEWLPLLPLARVGVLVLSLAHGSRRPLRSRRSSTDCCGFPPSFCVHMCLLDGTNRRSLSKWRRVQRRCIRKCTEQGKHEARRDRMSETVRRTKSQSERDAFNAVSAASRKTLQEMQSGTAGTRTSPATLHSKAPDAKSTPNSSFSVQYKPLFRVQALQPIFVHS